MKRSKLACVGQTRVSFGLRCVSTNLTLDFPWTECVSIQGKSSDSSGTLRAIGISCANFFKSISYIIGINILTTISLIQAHVVLNDSDNIVSSSF